MGWDSEQESIWFDADSYTESEAWDEFREVESYNQKGYPYTYYEYDGEKYYSVEYVGLYDDDNMPASDDDITIW